MSDNLVSFAFNNFQVKIFDLRKGLKTPLKTLKEDCLKIGGTEEHLALGLKNGFVKLYKDYEFIKRFDTLTTDITQVKVND